MSLEDNNLVVMDAGGFVHRLRIEAPPAEIGFGPSDKEGGTLMNFVKTAEIEITAVHDIDGTDFDDLVVAPVSFDTFAKILWRNEIHQLRKDCFPGIHRPSPSWVMKEIGTAEKIISNR